MDRPRLHPDVSQKTLSASMSVSKRPLKLYRILVVSYKKKDMLYKRVDDLQSSEGSREIRRSPRADFPSVTGHHRPH